MFVSSLSTPVLFSVFSARPNKGADRGLRTILLRTKIKMSEGLQQYFEDILSRYDGLLAILVTDRDGVPIVKVTDEKVPVSALRPSFLATFATATEQASKLGLSRNKNIICTFPSYQAVHFNYLPVVVSVIATSEANTGLILSLEKDFSKAIKDVKVAVDGV